MKDNSTLFNGQTGMKCLTEKGTRPTDYVNSSISSTTFNVGGYTWLLVLVLDEIARA